MYVPGYTRIEERAQITAFLHEYGFATLITQEEGRLCASHLPVLYDPATDGWGTLRSHMARANPQWRQFRSDQDVLCIFHGPHAYISPRWYAMQHTVPTWNYGTVHVYGRATLVDAPARLRAIVQDTTDKYESLMPPPWQMPLTQDEIDQMLKAVTGFRIEITRVEAKFKLGQNRSIEDQDGMLAGLERSDHPGSRELAAFIRQHRDGSQRAEVTPAPHP
jgi:transcriptional regulator